MADVAGGDMLRALRADPAAVLGRMTNDALLEMQANLQAFLAARFEDDRVEVVLNTRRTGFLLSMPAIREMRKKGLEIPHNPDAPAFRSDPRLIAVVKEMGQWAAADGCFLGVFSIPRHLTWQIIDTEGAETIHVTHEGQGSVRPVTLPTWIKPPTLEPGEMLTRTQAPWHGQGVRIQAAPVYPVAENTLNIRHPGISAAQAAENLRRLGRAGFGPGDFADAPEILAGLIFQATRHDAQERRTGRHNVGPQGFNPLGEALLEQADQEERAADDDTPPHPDHPSAEDR